MDISAFNQKLVALPPLQGIDYQVLKLHPSVSTDEARAQVYRIAQTVGTAALRSYQPGTPEWYRFSAFNEYAKSLVQVGSAPSDLTDCQPCLRAGALRFDQIAGQTEIKTILRREYINPFLYPGLFRNVAKGVLLYGVPGSGKTSLARAASNEIPNSKFFCPNVSQIRGKYVGDTERNIRAIFECAENEVRSGRARISIIFFDEFEQIGGSRKDNPGDLGLQSSVNAILQTMDGIEKLEGVTVVAATNYPQRLDDAVVRRFTTRIFIDLPDEKAVEYIIREQLALAYTLRYPGETPEEFGRRVRSEITVPYESGGIRTRVFNPRAVYLMNMTRCKRCKLQGEAVDVVNDEYIRKELVARFMRSKDAEMALEKLDDKTLAHLPSHAFGYSPSDIVNIIQTAIKIAAMRSLTGRFIPQEIEFDTGQKLDIYEYDASETEHTAVPVARIPQEEWYQLVNLVLYQHEIEEAIRSYTSTVDNDDYVSLVGYSRLASRA